MKTLVLLFCLMVSLVPMAVAQSRTSSDVGSGEFFAGYEHLTGSIGKNGWNAGATYNLARSFAAEGELGGYYGGRSGRSDHVHSFLVGPRIVFHRRDTRFTPFAHLLLGAAHQSGSVSDSDTSFAWSLGGGVDWALTQPWAFQVKADIFHNNFFDHGDTHARFGMGLAYRFGR